MAHKKKGIIHHGKSSKGGRRAAAKKGVAKHAKKQAAKQSNEQVIDSYQFSANNLPVKVTIYSTPEDYVPIYSINTPGVTAATDIILEQIRRELIEEVQLGVADITDEKRQLGIKERFEKIIYQLVRKYFPDSSKPTEQVLVATIAQRTLGLGDIENVMHDDNLEEVAINNADEPVWVYHRKWGWLKTSINLKDEDQIRHYAAMIGRRVGRELTMLKPLMDANLRSGDRVNATIAPVSSKGNTITLRKFATKPWTITDMISNKTIDSGAAAFLWLAIQNELSVLISGGTATGKTSFLNALSMFIPPNQRIVSIEDTRELQLPSFLQWIPMVTRQPNQEDKGAVSMLDLMVNSLRMRPDRILVGEIRRQREAEVLFEAIHTGHSVYATVHANNAEETITRLTSPPINIPKTMLPALSIICVQYRNRRTGIRRTFQLAEITHDGGHNVLRQYDIRNDVLRTRSKSKSALNTLRLYTGISPHILNRDLKQKEQVLNLMVEKNLNSIDSVGAIMAEYYRDPAKCLQKLRTMRKAEPAKEKPEKKGKSHRTQGHHSKKTMHPKNKRHK